MSERLNSEMLILATENQKCQDRKHQIQQLETNDELLLFRRFKMGKEVKLRN